MKMKKEDKSNWLIHPLLIIWALLQLYPLFWLAISSLKPTAEIIAHVFALPKSLYLDNYNFVLFSQRSITIVKYFMNSAVVTATTMLILTAVALLAGYAVAKLSGPGKT